MKAAQINKNKTIRRILMANMLEVKHINKTYKGQVSYQALKQISFSIEEGGFTAVMGPSGSGKTTLLNIISTIDLAGFRRYPDSRRKPAPTEADKARSFPPQAARICVSGFQSSGHADNR